MISIGWAGGTDEAALDEFMARACEQRKHSWNETYTALIVGNYVRAGFGKDELDP